MSFNIKMCVKPTKTLYLASLFGILGPWRWRHQAT